MGPVLDLESFTFTVDRLAAGEGGEGRLVAAARLCALAMQVAASAAHQEATALGFLSRLGVQGPLGAETPEVWSRTVMVVTAACDDDPELVESVVVSDGDDDLVLANLYRLTRGTLSFYERLTGMPPEDAFLVLVEAQY